MSYENEESSLIATSKFNNHLLSNQLFYSNFQFNNKHKNKILHALQYLFDNKYIEKNTNNNKKNIHNGINCIDGSFVSQIDNYGGEYINMQFGSAFLDIDKLFSISSNSRGNINPFDVANLFNNNNNLLFGAQFPSKNIYFNKNGEILTLKSSFIQSVNHLFNQDSNHIVESFLDDLKAIDNDFSNLKNFIQIDNIKKILNDIREDSVIYTTEKEVQKLMLISETILSQYLLKNNYNNNLIILDGRLHNQDIGDYIKKININKISQESMLIGVQKTGILNIILSEIKNIFEEGKCPDKKLKSLFDLYKDGNGFFMILTDEFKVMCGLPNFKIGNYGTECFYITEAPKRQEFVFTLPEHLFENYNLNSSKNDTKNIILKICNLFEHAHSDLYLGNKGVLLANVLAHNNVALNKQLTSISSNLETNIPTSKNKMKI